jgi:hypothetical protein
MKLLLESSANNGNPVSLTQNLKYIRAFYCQNHKHSATINKYRSLYNITKELVSQGILISDGPLPQHPKSTNEYERYKKTIIPAKILQKITITPSAQEIFIETVDKCCSPLIAKRLKEHVYTFKVQKHHRAPLITFLSRISKASQDWYKHPKIIQGELQRYRDDLLDTYQLNTAYNHFQNVANAFRVLIEHQLLPNSIELPGNFRRCTGTAKIRSNNPVISDFDIFDNEKKRVYIKTERFLSDYKEDLEENLSLITSKAKIIVHEGYRKYRSKEEIITKSEIKEFIYHPKLLLTNKITGGKRRKELNPFYKTYPLNFENRLATIDHFFYSVAKNETLPDVSHLSANNELLEFLGLTSLVASAMQIVIVEELGINPYSLYSAKVVSDGHGHEFIQINDKGSVRLKTLKLRARKVRENQAYGNNKDLLKINAQEIDAAACLKMALEMTARTRSITNRNELWICLSHIGATVPIPGVFQKNFKKIVKSILSPKAVLSTATLKKIRVSKALLIYLESNGDTLKASRYLGNKVKTALTYYIPSYLTELVYRIRIRSFQNILLYMAVAHDDSPAISLNMSDEEFKSSVLEAFSNPYMGGELFSKLVSGESMQNNADKKYFCLSEKNISLAIRYAQEGQDEGLKKDCETVLAKISEGSIAMKQLLRKAQTAIAKSC